LTHQKTKVRKVSLYGIYEKILHLKLICTYQAHQPPQKSNLVEIKNEILLMV